MIKNFLKITFRNLLRHKGFSAINISGLAIGMASAILIFLWMFNEISYDRFHANKDYLYQAWNRGVFDGKLQCWSSTPQLLGPTLKLEYPEVANISRYYSRWFVTKVGDKKVSSQAIIADPSFLSMFSFPLLKGNVNTVLNSPYSMVITEKMAKKMFGDADPMGKLINIDKDNFTVTGIFKDPPVNTVFQFEYMLPWDYHIKINGDDKNWGNNSINTFVQLKTGVNADLLGDKIKDITIKHSNKAEEHEVFLHPVSKWHLYSTFENGKIAGGRITIVRLFGIIACLILLIACINL